MAIDKKLIDTQGLGLFKELYDEELDGRFDKADDKIIEVSKIAKSAGETARSASSLAESANALAQSATTTAQSAGGAAQAANELAQAANNTATAALSATQELASAKQDLLISDVNIKTVAGQSLLGTGNLDIYTKTQTDEAIATAIQQAITNAVEASY